MQANLSDAILNTFNCSQAEAAVLSPAKQPLTPNRQYKKNSYLSQDLSTSGQRHDLTGGVPSEPGNILITTGSRQGIELLPRSLIDLHTSTFNQFLIYEFISQGYLDTHIEGIKSDYLARRNLMLKTMDETFPEGITRPRPEGGLFLWVELPKTANTRCLLDKAVEMKTAYVPGQASFPHEGIVEGIQRLGSLFAENM